MSTLTSGEPPALYALIDQIYHAATSPGTWRDLMPDLVHFVGGTSGQLFHPDENAARGIWAPYRIPVKLMEDYAAYFRTIDPWLAGILAARSPSGQALLGDQIVERHSFVRTEYYSDFLIPYNIGEIVSCGIELGADKGENLPATGISIYREIGTEPFEQAAAARLSVLGPHVRKALRLSWRLQSVQHENAARTQALDQLPSGVALLDATGQIVYMNVVGEALCREGDGLRIEKRRLHAEHPDEHARLTVLIHTALSDLTASVTTSRDSVAVSRPSGQSPYRITVIPLARGKQFPVGPRPPCAIAFVVDENRQVSDGAQRMCASFDLTPAQARLVLAIAKGNGLKIAARELGISVHTAHTQLAQVFDKTGTRRQSDLVRLISEYIPLS